MTFSQQTREKTCFKACVSSSFIIFFPLLPLSSPEDVFGSNREEKKRGQQQKRESKRLWTKLSLFFSFPCLSTSFCPCFQSPFFLWRRRRRRRETCLAFHSVFAIRRKKRERERERKRGKRRRDRKLKQCRRDTSVQHISKRKERADNRRQREDSEREKNGKKSGKDVRQEERQEKSHKKRDEDEEEGGCDRRIKKKERRCLWKKSSGRVANSLRR